MSILTKAYEWVSRKGLLLAVFLFVIFLFLTLIFNLLGLIVQGPIGLTPTIISLLITLFVWIGLNQAN
jgi:hypothetical protein